MSTRLDHILRPLATIGSPFLLYLAFAAFSLTSTALYLYLFPSVSLAADMWAEEATVYFHAANSKPWTEAMLQLDAGYRVFFAMLTAVTAKLIGLSPSGASIFYGFVALFVRSLCSFVIILPIFRKLIAADWVRILIGFSILTHTNYDLKTLVNVSYFGIFPVILTLLLLFQSRSLKFFPGLVLSLMIGFFCLSKAYFVVFAPSLAVLLMWAFLRKEWMIATLSTTGLAGIAFQLATALNNTSKFTRFDEAANFSLIGALKSVFEQVYGSLMGETSGAIKVATRAHIFDLIGLYLIFLLLRHINNNRSQWLKFSRDYWFHLFTFASIIFGTALVNYQTSIYRFDWVRVVPIPHLSSRHHFFVTASIFLGIIWFLQNSPWPKASVRNSLSLAFLVLSYPFGIAQSALTARMIKHPVHQVEQQFSHWPELQDGEGPSCTPINPYPWAYQCVRKVNFPSNRDLQKAEVIEMNRKTIHFTIPTKILDSLVLPRELLVGISVYGSCKAEESLPVLQFPDSSKETTISRPDRLFKIFRIKTEQITNGMFSLHLPCPETYARIDSKTGKPFVIYLQ